VRFTDREHCRIGFQNFFERVFVFVERTRAIDLRDRRVDLRRVFFRARERQRYTCDLHVF
jgi:hypothetical protein